MSWLRFERDSIRTIIYCCAVENIRIHYITCFFFILFQRKQPKYITEECNLMTRKDRKNTNYWQRNSVVKKTQQIQSQYSLKKYTHKMIKQVLSERNRLSNKHQPHSCSVSSNCLEYSFIDSFIYSFIRTLEKHFVSNSTRRLSVGSIVKTQATWHMYTECLSDTATVIGVKKTALGHARIMCSLVDSKRLCRLLFYYYDCVKAYSCRCAMGSVLSVFCD